MNKLFLSVILLSLLFLLNCGGPKETRVEGQVLDETGAPYAGLQLSAAPRDTGDLGETLETVSAEDGSFVFSGLLPSVIYQLSIAGTDLQIEFASPPKGKTGRLPEPLVLIRERFRRSAKGRVVTDLTSGLDWFVGPVATYDSAVEWADALKLAGKKWRLPSREELLTLHEPGRSDYNIDPAFYDKRLIRVWSSEETISDGARAVWVFNFRRGRIEVEQAVEEKRRTFAVSGVMKK